MPAAVMMVHKNKLAMARTDALLIITGSMGSGKTSVLSEASDILAIRKRPARFHRLGRTRNGTSPKFG